MASAKKIVYTEVDVHKYVKGDKKDCLGPITVEKAAELVGWTDEAAGKELFGADYKLRDCSPEGSHKIRLANCVTNRPFRRSLALRYANEYLRGKMVLNGETIIIDNRGDVQDGQHRLVGLILAEQLRKKTPEHWKQYGVNGPVKMEGIVVVGISDKPEVVDTINLGQKRSLGDVLFRNREFEKADEREQVRLTNQLAGAIRVAWIRCGGATVSDAKHFPHTEALDFVGEHPELLKCVSFIAETNEGTEGDDKNRIKKYISLPYAAGLCYLQGTTKTDAEKFAAEGASALNYDNMDKAYEFWELFAAGADLAKDNPILSLRNLLAGMSASGAAQRDDIIAAVVLAWNAWIDGKPASQKDLKVQRKKNDKGVMVVIDPPFMGGLDIFREVTKPAEPVKEESKAPDKKTPAKAPPKAAGKKAPPKPVKKAAESKAPPKSAKITYPYKKGDVVFVMTKEKDGSMNNYEGTINRMVDDGKIYITTVLEDGSSFECTINPTTDKNVTVHTEKPADFDQAA